VFVGVVLVGYALVLWPRHFPQPAREDAKAAPLRMALRAALGSRRLRLWTLGVLCCEFMDEILVAFGALHLRDHVGATIAERAVILSAGVAGGVVGLVLLERLLARFEPRRMLASIAAASALSYLVWLRAETVATSAAALFVTGVFVAGHYPLAKAQAYRAFPGRSGTVNALLTLAGVVQLPIPVLIGFAADDLGLSVALSLLLLQPLGLLAVALLSLRGDSSAEPSEAQV
jgi:fucose permease